MKLVALKRIRYNRCWFTPGQEIIVDSKELADDFVRKGNAIEKGEPLIKSAAPIVVIPEIEDKPDKIEVSARDLNKNEKEDKKENKHKHPTSTSAKK